MAQFFKKDALEWWRSVYEGNPLIFSVLTLDQMCAMVEQQFEDIDHEMKIRDRALRHVQ